MPPGLARKTTGRLSLTPAPAAPPAAAATPGGAVYCAVHSAAERDEDFQQLSTFERVVRAACINRDELDGVLHALAAPADEAGKHDLKDDDLVTTDSLQAARHALVNTCSLAPQLTGERTLASTLLATGGSRLSPIEWAAARGVPHAVGALLDAGAVQPDGRALRLALQSGNDECARKILAHRSTAWLHALAAGPEAGAADGGGTDEGGGPGWWRRLLVNAAALAGTNAVLPRQAVRHVELYSLPKAVLDCLRVVQHAKHNADRLLARDPAAADVLTMLDVELQLCVAARMPSPHGRALERAAHRCDGGPQAAHMRTHHTRTHAHTA